MTTDKNPHTGDPLRSKVPTKEYEENHDKIDWSIKQDSTKDKEKDTNDNT